jgi:hypothetical protein
MSIKSTHYGDISMWIKKVIDSCQTHDQLRSARQLIVNFDKLMTFRKVNPATLRKLSSSLYCKERDKFYSIYIDNQK